MSYFDIKTQLNEADRQTWIRLVEIRNIIALRFASITFSDVNLKTIAASVWSPNEPQFLAFWAETEYGRRLSCQIGRTKSGEVAIDSLTLYLDKNNRKAEPDHPLLCLIRMQLDAMLSHLNKGVAA